MYLPLVFLAAAGLIAITAYFLRISFGVAGSALGGGTTVSQRPIAPVASRAPDEVAMPQGGGAPDNAGSLPGQSVGGGTAVQGGPPAQVVRLLTEFRARLNRNPNDVDALVGLAGLYAEANMFPKAMPLYARAVVLDPGSAQTRTAYAVALHAQGRDADALQQLDLVVGRHGDYSPALYAQGVVAAAMGQRAVAVAAYRRFLVVAPNDPQADDARSALRTLGAT